MKDITQVHTVPKELHAEDPGELKQELASSIMKVTFTKKSTGEERTMYATNHPIVTTRDGITPKNENPEGRPDNLIVTYSIDRKGWRSFYFDNITSAYVLDVPVTEQLINEVLNSDGEETV